MQVAILVGIINICMIVMQSIIGVHASVATNERIVNEQSTRKLKVIGYARGLADKDRWTASQSDRSLHQLVVAINRGRQTMTTPTQGGTDDPMWSDILEFEERTCKKLSVSDDDGAGRRPSLTRCVLYKNLIWTPENNL